MIADTVEAHRMAQEFVRGFEREHNLPIQVIGSCHISVVMPKSPRPVTSARAVGVEMRPKHLKLPRRFRAWR